jgi:DNA repair exonuclease SbcCD nuclease subunit
MADAAPVVIIYGNHDRPGDLDGFANLKAGHPIYVIDRPHVLVLRLATQQMAAIFCLPYPQKAGLVAAASRRVTSSTSPATCSNRSSCQAAAQLAGVRARPACSR